MREKKSSGGFAASLATKVILRVVTIVLIAAAVFLFAAFAFNKFQKVRVQNKRAAVERELAECAELVLYKMRYSDIVTIRIPPTVLLGNDIYSQEVFDEQQRLFTRITTQEVFDQIEAAKQEAADEILAEGLLDDADARAKQVLSSLLRPLGFQTVTVELK